MYKWSISRKLSFVPDETSRIWKFTWGGECEEVKYWKSPLNSKTELEIKNPPAFIFMRQHSIFLAVVSWWNKWCCIPLRSAEPSQIPMPAKRISHFCTFQNRMHHSSIPLNGSFQLANGVPSPSAVASGVCLIIGPKRGGGGGGGGELPIITYTERLRPKWVHFSGFRYTKG